MQTTIEAPKTAETNLLSFANVVMISIQSPIGKNVSDPESPVGQLFRKYFDEVEANGMDEITREFVRTHIDPKADHPATTKIDLNGITQDNAFRFIVLSQL